MAAQAKVYKPETPYRIIAEDFYRKFGRNGETEAIDRRWRKLGKQVERGLHGMKYVA